MPSPLLVSFVGVVVSAMLSTICDTISNTPAVLFWKITRSPPAAAAPGLTGRVNFPPVMDEALAPTLDVTRMPPAVNVAAGSIVSVRAAEVPSDCLWKRKLLTVASAASVVSVSPAMSALPESEVASLFV